ENTWTLKSKVKGPDGKLHTFVSKDTERDSWRKIGGKWKLSLIKQLTESTTIDGKSLRNTGAQVSHAFTREALKAYS
ncbi:MAG: hypothetical protein QOJ65_1456, partial [Fimbriimonadaceae bacterium]|nr:hypothetical protein [Fimbriimonadaceae bacterium]